MKTLFISMMLTIVGFGAGLVYWVGDEINGYPSPVLAFLGLQQESSKVDVLATENAKLTSSNTYVYSSNSLNASYFSEPSGLSDHLTASRPDADMPLLESSQEIHGDTSSNSSSSNSSLAEAHAQPSLQALTPSQVQAALSLLADSGGLTDLDLAEVSLMLYQRQGSQAAMANGSQGFLLALQKKKLHQQLEQDGLLSDETLEKTVLAEILKLEQLPEGRTLQEYYRWRLGQARKTVLAEGIVPSN